MEQQHQQNKIQLYAAYQRLTLGSKTQDESKKIKKYIYIFHANSSQKRAGVTILKPNKINFKTKSVRGDKEQHAIQREVCQQGITTIST